jgi:hypothetical protein
MLFQKVSTLALVNDHIQFQYSKQYHFLNGSCTYQQITYALTSLPLFDGTDRDLKQLTSDMHLVK